MKRICVIVICSTCRAELYSINWIITLITIAGLEKQEVFPALHGHASRNGSQESNY